VTVTVLVVASLFVAGLAEWLDSNGAHLEQVVVSVSCALGTVGVTWLGWNWMKLGDAIKPMVNLLDGQKTQGDEDNRFEYSFGAEKLRQLSNTVVETFNHYCSAIGQLENQINDLQIRMQLAQRQKRNIESIIYGIRDAVIVVDEFDKLLMANEAAGRLFNFDFKAAQHRPLRELLCGEQAVDGAVDFVDILYHSRKSQARAIRREIILSEGIEPRTFDCIISCVNAEQEQVCGAVAVLHDITREKEVSQMKSDFVSHVSHELKTPLASITAYSEMLADGEANDEQMVKEFCSIIQYQAQRLNRLIEDILNISRIESGLIKVSKEPFSLTILIEEQLQMIRAAASEKNINVVGQKPIVFDQVYADKDMISQVIVNLLSNAVKYTPEGGKVEVQTELDETAGKLCVNVTDTGVGIPENEVEHVFNKFYRVDANKKQAKGTGLGLNLVKQIVEKVHHGRVFVKSQIGIGSTFGFELPLGMQNEVEGSGNTTKSEEVARN
jgi:two-component system phosphate regulon sensor histidine kinase PhoR